MRLMAMAEARGPEPQWPGEVSHHYDQATLDYIQRAAETGVYDIRGLGAKRRVPSFDDLTFLTASMSRYPLEGYRERCSTQTVLGTRRAERPLTLATPITIAGMSFGSLSANVKEALGRAATAAGTSTTTGDGGMTPEERRSSKTLVYQCLPSRYGFNPDDLRRADAVEIVIGQGAKPGGGGMLLGLKVSERVARMRTLPAGIDQRSACRHPDWVGPDDLAIKIEELREVTDNRIPVFIKIGATRVPDDVKLCVKSGADVIVLDGMQGGTAATQQVFIEHAGIPTLPAVRQAVEALEEVDPAREVQLVVSGGIRSGADVAKALALGADAGVDRPGGADGAGLQQPELRPRRRTGGRYRRLPSPGYRAWPLSPVPDGAVPGGRDHAGPGAGATPGPGVGRPAGEELPGDPDHGAGHAGARLRQVGRPPPGARGPGGADRGGGPRWPECRSRAPAGSRGRTERLRGDSQRLRAQRGTQGRSAPAPAVRAPGRVPPIRRACSRRGYR